MRFESIAEAVGRTPLVRLKNVEREYGLRAKLFVKVESMNPVGSVKDRVAAEILRAAEESGKLNADTTLIEPTSGNTGIGLAALAAAKGYKMIIVMPETMSLERRQTIAAFGARLVLTEGSAGMKGAIAKAEELHKEIANSLICGQFVNPANPAAHYKNTGGTITGVGRFLKEKKSAVRIVAVEPASSPVLSEGRAGAHKIQGIGAGFVPEILDTKIYDEAATVTDEDAYAFSRLLAKKEGLLAGISSGAALCAAVRVASRPESEGKTIVALLPDTGDRYLSCGLFGD